MKLLKIIHLTVFPMFLNILGAGSLQFFHKRIRWIDPGPGLACILPAVDFQQLLVFFRFHITLKRVFQKLCTRTSQVEFFRKD